MIANTTTSAREEEIPVRPARRFSEGMERSPLTPSTLRVGRFSDGTAPSLALSADVLGSFADGLVDRPDPSKPLPRRQLRRRLRRRRTPASRAAAPTCRGRTGPSPWSWPPTPPALPRRLSRAGRPSSVTSYVTLDD